jgi:hypothetical protein
VYVSVLGTVIVCVALPVVVVGSAPQVAANALGASPDTTITDANEITENKNNSVLVTLNMATLNLLILPLPHFFILSCLFNLP